MVIIELNGGMGNQLFQYAAGRALAESHQVDWCLYPKVKGHQTDRNYVLDRFNIPQQMAPSAEVRRLSYWEKGLMGKLAFAITEGGKLYYKRKSFKEQGPAYDPQFFQALDDVYLSGHWQSPKYFNSIRELLLKQISLKEVPSSEFKSYAAQMEKGRTVSLHVRRGDYTSANYSKSLGVCPPAYYQRALNELSTVLGVEQVFIFSDDIDWVKENLDLGSPCTHIEAELSDEEELLLMTQCKDHIIANSSFSWWGAWLDPKPDKRVIAPEHWFNEKHRDPVDVIPSEWTRI